MASGVRQLIAMMQDVRKVAKRYDPPAGVVELIDVEYVLLADLMREMIGVWTDFHMRATDPVEGVPMPPPVMNALAAIATVQAKTATTVEAIPALARKVCADRLALLDDPKQAMFDLRANPGGSGQGTP